MKRNFGSSEYIWLHYAHQMTNLPSTQYLNQTIFTLITAPACLYCSAESFAALSALCSTCTFNPCFTKDWAPVGEAATLFSPLHFFGNSHNQVHIVNTYKIKDTTKYKDFPPQTHVNLVFI